VTFSPHSVIIGSACAQTAKSATHSATAMFFIFKSPGFTFAPTLPNADFSDIIL
jgi:hypothetical protein